MTTVAVIGGGASGMGAAHAMVKAGLAVTLFESEPKLGGHCFGVSVPLAGGGSVRIDAGVSDFNKATFVTVGSLLEELGVEYYPVCQDASFMTPDRASVWYSRGGQPHFLIEPLDRERLLAEIKRFNASCVEVLSDITYTEWTAGKYLDAHGYSEGFRRLYFNPRAQGCFPMPDRKPEDYMIRSIVAFWRMHGIVGPGPSERMVVKGGMHTYCAAFDAWMRARGAEVLVSTRIVGIARRKNRVRIRAVDAVRANLTFEFDHVVIASNANHVIPLLEDPTQEEQRIFAGFGWQRSRLVVHQDERMMPRDRATWGAYNYLIAEGGDPEIRPTITFHPNLLAGLDKQTEPGSRNIPDIFVTMNPYREPDPAKIITNQFFIHPAVGGITDMACERLDAIQGRRGTWFCGSYMREPFVHEQAMRCGTDIGERLVESLRPGASVSSSRVDEIDGFDDFLHEIPLFTGLDTLALAEVQLVAQPFQAWSGQTLFRQGDDADGMYLLKDGEVRVTRRLPGDDLMELARLGRGALIGEMGLLDRGRRSASAIASEKSSGYFIRFDRFELLRANFSRSAFAVINRFVNEVAQRTRTLVQEMADLIELTPELAPGKRTADELPPGEDAASMGATDVEPGGFVTQAKTKKTRRPELPASEEVLARLPFFMRLDPEELKQFVKPLRVTTLPRNTVLFRRGDPPGECMIVLRGALTLSLEKNGGFIQYAVLGPGCVAGEFALLDGRSHLLDCRVREETIALVMDRDRFEHLRQGGGPVAFKFVEAVADGVVSLLRKANGHIAWLRPERQYRAEQTMEGVGDRAEEAN